ncbi:uncharacterized protein JCM15063_003641 [Sporobolomyces koalae]|uniref:uncharacterized protein n=1 Tax=Sporobolomyces koalae TaxID=500713 RepID=UPI003179A620
MESPYPYRYSDYPAVASSSSPPPSRRDDPNLTRRVPPPPIPPRNPYYQQQHPAHPPPLAPAPLPAPPRPPAGAFNPLYPTYDEVPSSPTTDAWRESRIISMYQTYPDKLASGGARHPSATPLERATAAPPPSTDYSTARETLPYTRNEYGQSAPPPAVEPVTFVSSSGATFSRDHRAASGPAYPHYAQTRAASYRRPLNPPPVPEYAPLPRDRSSPQPNPQVQSPYETQYQNQNQQPYIDSYQSDPTQVRLSNDSEHYSVYSYSGSIDSTGTASAFASNQPTVVTSGSERRLDGLPSRKQSLEHFKALSLRDRESQGSPSSQTYSFHDEPIPEADVYNPRTRQPTILMSPPLESSGSSAQFDSYSSSSRGESVQPYRRNPSVDASWSASSAGRTSSYGSTSTSAYSQHNPAYASTMQTSPAPSPSLSHSYSFDQRKPSHSSSLSPHVSTSYYRSAPSDSYSLLSPSPSTSDLLPSDANDARDRFLNPAYLSHLAVYLKDHVPRERRVKGSVEHWGFTGKEIVDTIVKVLPSPASLSSPVTSPSTSLVPPPLPTSSSSSSLSSNLPLTLTAPITSPTPASSPLITSPIPSPSSLHPPVASHAVQQPSRQRALALSIARTLQQSLYFHEVDFSTSRLTDSDISNQVYAFLFELPHSDNSNSRQDHHLESESGTAGGEEIPTGIVTELTRCESLVCSRENAEGRVSSSDGSVLGGCYSFTCPNRPRNSLHRVGSTISTNSGMVEAPLEEADNWASSVPKSILDSLDKTEIAYQNQIFELIHGEQKYLDDLNLIETGFVEPLKHANPPIIQPHRLPHFLASILLNIAEIRQHSSTLLSALRAKQQESLVVRGGIGKIILMSAVEWGHSYIQYTTGFPMADWLFKEEKEQNPRFNELLMDFHKRPEASKRGFDTFHNRATFRGLRYILLLEQIAKNAPTRTDQDLQDREYLEEAIKVIKQQGKEADRGVGETKAKVSLREWERNLVRKQGDLHDLEMLDESRQFFLSGRVYRRPEGSGFTDQFQEAHLVLLDNYLITTKAPRPDRDGKQKYLISRRPVPLDLIQLKASSFSEPPVPRSSGFHLRSNRSAGSNPQGSAPSASAYAPQDSSLLYPISFFQMGRFDGLVHLYVDTPAQRLEWERKMREAVALREQRQEASRVVRLDPLADATFGTTSTIGSLNAGPAQGTNQFGKPTCSTPLQTIEGLWLVIAGCQEGIFIGWRGRPGSMQQVVHLGGITQCAVLPDFSFLLVVANKVLVAYALEALIPTKTANKFDQANKAPQRLSGQKDVSFFRVGKVGDTDPRTLVIYAKKSGVKESVFKALEPVNQNDRTKGASGGHRFLGFGSGRPEWFRVHKEFFVPSLVTSLQFQRSKLALIGTRGVEIIDLESMRTMTVPDFPSVRHNRNFVTLAKRCEEVPTLGMFRIADSKFLLVYADFAFHVGRHGEPIEGPFIEWESKPEQVAYCFPYIFAISPTIIEIRNAFTGRLAQFITGSHIFLTFDGSAISSTQTPSLPSRGSSLSSASNTQSNIDAETPVEKRLHVSMRTGAFHVLYEIVIVA